MKIVSLTWKSISILIVLALLNVTCSFILVNLIMCNSSNFKLLSYSIKSSAGTDYVYPGSKNVQLTIELQYNGSQDIASVFGYLSLPPGFSVSRGGQAISPAYNPNGSTYDIVRPGDAVLFKYSIDISENITPGTYTVALEVSYRYIGTMTTQSEIVSGIRITVSSYPELKLYVMETYWSPNGYPGSEGVSLNIVIENNGDSDIVNGHIKIDFPSIINPRSVELDIGTISRKGRTTITIGNLAISPDAKPDQTYVASMTLRATARTVDGVLYTDEVTLSFNLKISSPPKVKILLVDYGIEPSYISSNVRSGSIYLVFQNKDFATINSITAVFRITHGGKFAMGRSSVATASGPYRYGDYITLRSDQIIFDPGSKEIRVTISLSIFGTKDGAEFWSSSSYVLTIAVPTALSKGKGLMIMDSNWQNGYPVYPNTENATFIISIINRWPYRIHGLIFNLSLPNGFYSNDPQNRRIATAYVSGPISSLDIFTVSFTISVANVTPGLYKAKLITDYVVECGNVMMEQHEEHYVYLRVNSLEEALELITTTWYGGSPEPGTYGAQLIILIRNNFIPLMRGVILEVYLPSGFTCSLNNESYARLTPSLITQLTPQVGGMLTPEELSTLIRHIISQQPSTQAIGQGDVILFVVPMNIETNMTGKYEIMAILNFIDQWNNIRNVKLKIPFNLLGSSKIINVRLPDSIEFINGEAVLNLTVVNKGSAPIYDTYIMLMPRMPLALPVEAFKYIGTIGAYKEKVVSFKLKYNPTSIMMMGGPTMMQYSSLPLIITIIYRDVLGYRRMLNLSSAVLIEPFVDIRLGYDTKATINVQEGKVLVTGTIINYGIAQARSLEVCALADNKNSSTFIGDLDPSSQAAFRIEFFVDKPVDIIKLVISYRDNYGRLATKSYMLNVTRIIPQASTLTETQQALPFITKEKMLVVVIVCVFLSFVGVIIYRLSRRHAQQLTEATRI